MSYSRDIREGFSAGLSPRGLEKRVGFGHPTFQVEDRTHGPEEGMGHCKPENSFPLAEAGAEERLRASCSLLEKEVRRRPKEGPWRVEEPVVGSFTRLHLDRTKCGAISLNSDSSFSFWPGLVHTSFALGIRGSTQRSFIAWGRGEREGRPRTPWGNLRPAR